MTQALLIIDAQQSLLDGQTEGQSVYEKEKLIATINTVVQKAITENAHIIFIRDLDVSDGKGPGFDIHNEIEIPSTAEIFNKAATNAFYGTELDSYLKDKNVKHILIMGCKTEQCIDTTVRAATVSGYDVTLVGDGHSTTDSKTLSAIQIILHHNTILHGHDNVDHFSLVRNSDQDLFSPIHDRYR